MPDSSDGELMRRVAQRDMNALALLVERYQRRVLAVAYRFTGDWPDAEDIAQEVFLRAFHAAARYEPSAQLMTWLYRITANLCLDMRRKRARRDERALPPDEAPRLVSSPATDHLEAKETAESIARAVEALPERQRLAVVLLRYEGLSYRQIATVLETSESAVDSLVSRAMAKLREELADLLQNQH